MLKNSKIEQQNKILPMILVPLVIAYEAAIICGAEPSKEAMKFYIKKIEIELDKIKNNRLYKIFNFFKINI